MKVNQREILLVVKDGQSTAVHTTAASGNKNGNKTVPSFFRHWSGANINRKSNPHNPIKVRKKTGSHIKCFLPWSRRRDLLRFNF